MSHRKIWKTYYGKIPKDKDGRSYEIHHKDGNRKNNSIDNLMCVTIKEHYDIHISQGDWGAATLIAKRMNLPSDYISKIQTGKKRPELIGKSGPKIGNVPWNKGISGYSLNTDRTGLRHTSKLSKEQVDEIKNLYSSRVNLQKQHLVGTTAKNGKILTYEQLFSKEYSEKFNVSLPTIKNIILGKYWEDGIIDVRK